MRDREDHLPDNHVRPRFKIESPLGVEEVLEKLKNALNEKDATCKGRVSPGYVTLFIPPQEQHYWSPQLSLTIEEFKNGSLLRGLYGPRPTVWTVFVFFYAIGLATLIISMLGLSYLTLGKPAAILWIVPVLVIIFLSLYLVAHFGKEMGYDQIVKLHRFLENSIDLKI